MRDGLTRRDWIRGGAALLASGWLGCRRVTTDRQGDGGPPDGGLDASIPDAAPDAGAVDAGLVDAEAPPSEHRGKWMGLSCGSTASTAELDGAAELGLGWVRVSHEMGWGGTIDDLAQTVIAAHGLGLKVLQCVQKSGKTYSETDASALALFAEQCAATGIDALEIGNEWNNPPFFQPQELPPALAATLSAAVGAWVRARYPSLPIVTNGLSPAPDDYVPQAWWPQFWDAASAAHAEAAYHAAAALHPFVYPEDPVTLTNPAWNGWYGLGELRLQMSARGLAETVWFTEIGCPGTDVDPPILRGIPLTEARQEYVTGRYLQLYREHGRPGEPLMIATLFDGESVSVPGPESFLGLRRADGSRKPAWFVVRDFAAEAIP